MSQIKRKLGTPSYSLQAFRNDMHLLFNNARQYNTEGSWVFNAAEDMQEFFDKMWEEELPRLSNGSASGGGSMGSRAVQGIKNEEAESAVPSGSSTPMFKPPGAAKLPTKIKINLGASKRQVPIEATPEAGSEESDMDDDY